MKKLKNVIIIILLTLIFLINNMTNVKATENVGNWNDWQQRDYWEWYTRTTTNDLAYNGEHIVINNDVIDFYGYGTTSYKDFLFKAYDKPGKKKFEFRIDESKSNYHTVDGHGFIFNAKIENNKFSGYMLLFRQKDITLYQLKDVNVNTFQTTANKVVANYGTVIKSVNKTNSQIHDLVVEATPTNLKVTESKNEILNVDLDYSKHAGDGFGLVASYTQHSCSILSKIEFSQLKIDVEDYEIKIYNTDLEEKPISGGEFELKDENGSVVKKGTTNSKGEFIVSGIKPGIYTVQQKKPPTGYILNDEIVKFQVDSNGRTINIDNNNEEKIIIKNEKIKKVEEKNNVIENNTIQSNIIDNNTIENNTIQNNTVNNVIKNETNKVTNIKNDTTVSKTILPAAGEKNIIVFGIIIVISLIYSYIKIKKYKDIK